jgi:disulfide bond formation protein DsbB
MRNILILLAAGGSAALLIAAYAAPLWGGPPPCELCLWQRYPHMVAVAIGVLALLLRGRTLPFLGGLAALTTAGIGAYHTGVERHWWQGPTACTSGSVAGVSPEDLLNRIMAAPVVRCDEVGFEFLTLSLASWNMLLALGFAALWFAAATVRRR